MVMTPRDSDFKICKVKFSELLEIQEEAERRGFGTRWSTQEALRKDVREGPLLLKTFIRESRGGDIRLYRCLITFLSTDTSSAGGVSTIDVDPEKLNTLERVDADPGAQQALSWLFDLAANGINTVSKG